MPGTWRDRCRPIIANVLRETAGQEDAVVRKALKEAYPFVEREMWPYKVWLDEIKVQRGLKRSKAAKTVDAAEDVRQQRMEL